ncbi:hypothetical protein EKO27_g11185 [Xylaria grammica]|uniref:Receptor L-domain domain-containing protein n=1 Tax=Xylaria grammica TaxID=363999 RepID=A0A439CP34_9PEZI|nr:hypothetical protein EKO27_g11185 [Xylaria grammica]
MPYPHTFEVNTARGPDGHLLGRQVADCTSRVTDQADVEKLTASPCNAIDIQGATGSLNFTNLTSTGTITIRGSPGLEVLSFPQITSLDALEISHATALTAVSLPLLGEGFLEIQGNGQTATEGHILSLNITDAPNLATLELQNSTYYEDLVLIGTPPAARDGLGIGNVSTALSIVTDSCLNFAGLKTVGDLQIIGSPGCDYALLNMELVSSFRVTNAGGTSIMDAQSYLFNNPPLQVNNSMILELSTIPRPAPFGSEIGLGRVTTVGDDLNITSNADAHINFYGVTDVGRTLSVFNNTNCTFDFGGVLNVANLVLLDNANTVIPSFPQLRRVENIHLRGHLNTQVAPPSAGPNIFPSLLLASGTVVVEAWNSDFNCSKLVSQLNAGIINSLVCNGTDNGTDHSAPRQNQNVELSAGAKAGIGVGSVFVLGIVVAIVWIVVHYRNRLRSLEKAHSQMFPASGKKESGEIGVGELHEMDGADFVREKPDDPITELPIGESELPGQFWVVELPAREIKLPSPSRKRFSV